MHITLADIEGMASPGWGEGSVEIPDLDLLDDLDGEAASSGSGDREDDCNEIAFNLRAKSEYQPEEEKPDVKGLYTDGGQREGLSTFEACERLKNERMLKKHRLEQEFAAILKIYPANGVDFKILMWLAHGFSYQQTAARLGRTHRTIKNVARRLRQFRDTGILRLLPPELVQSGEALWEPLQPSRAGRKKRSTEGEIIQLDLLGDPIQVRERKARRQANGVRKARMRPTMPGQLSLFDFDMAA